MRKSSKVLTATLLVTFAFFAFGQVSNAHSELTGIEEKALTYMENVLPLDFAHYNITWMSYQLPEAPNATYREDAVTFTLNSSDSMLVVVCMFRDGVQHTCDMRVQKDSPAYVRDCSDLLEVARIIIEKHQAQTGVDCSDLLKTLKMVVTTENLTAASSGNVKLTVSSGLLPIGLHMANGTLHVDPSKTINITSFNWAYNIDGEQRVGFLLDFDNGNLHSLRDERIISNVSINQGEPDLQSEPTAAPPAPVSAPSASASNITSSQVEPLQSQPAVFPFAPVAAASALGIVAASVGATFYYRRRLNSKKSASVPINPNEASQ